MSKSKGITIPEDIRKALEALPDTRRSSWTETEDEAICLGYGVKDSKAFYAFMKKHFDRAATAVHARAGRLRADGKPVAMYIKARG